LRSGKKLGHLAQMLLRAYRMQTIGGLSLLAALVICYMLYFRSQDASGQNTVEDSRPIAVAPAGPGDLRPASLRIKTISTGPTSPPTRCKPNTRRRIRIKDEAAL
jgi:hypothetical protein